MFLSLKAQQKYSRSDVKCILLFKLLHKVDILEKEGNREQSEHSAYIQQFGEAELIIGCTMRTIMGSKNSLYPTYDDP